MVQDLSVNTDATFDKVKCIDNKAIVVGGRQYYEAAIYILNQDNGIEKVPLPGNITNKEIYGIDISPEGSIMAVGYDASVFTSNDSGKSWHFTQNGIWQSFQDIAFRDKDTAFVAINKGFSIGAIATLNADGRGSDVVNESRNFAMDDIDFVNSQLGYLCGYGAVMKTTDGGQVWTFTTAKNDYFKAMSWKNELEGIAVGYAGSIIQTSDGGASWHTSRNGNNFLKKKIHFLSIENNGKDTYIATGEKGFVCITYNNGDTWQEVKHFTEKDLKGLCFKNEHECIIVGAEGGLFLLKL